MNIEERDGWLVVILEASDHNPDLDWNGLITWKIPESERVYVPESDTWMVLRKHRQLVNTLFFIYQVLGKDDPHPEVLKQASQMLKGIEKWYTAGKDMRGEIRRLLGFKKHEIGLN